MSPALDVFAMKELQAEHEARRTNRSLCFGHFTVIR
jgi:hypothetical protein